MKQIITKVLTDKSARTAKAAKAEAVKMTAYVPWRSL
jgi:hypothetical protein